MSYPDIQKPVFKQKYRCYVGDDFDLFVLTWKNPDNTPIDFTGATAVSQFKTSRDDGAALLTLTDTNGITLGNSTDNIILTLTHQQTRLLGAGIFYFDIQITQIGKVRTYADCILILEKSVS